MSAKHMSNSIKSEWSVNEVAKWLVAALEGHVSSRQIQLELVSRFGFAVGDALIAEECACDGILLAISGSMRDMPNAKTDPVGHAAFKLVWDTFSQNSFFDKRRMPNRQWLDWKEQQTYRQFD